MAKISFGMILSYGRCLLLICVNFETKAICERDLANPHFVKKLVPAPHRFFSRVADILCC